MSETVGLQEHREDHEKGHHAQNISIPKGDVVSFIVHNFSSKALVTEPPESSRSTGSLLILPWLSREGTAVRLLPVITSYS